MAHKKRIVKGRDYNENRNTDGLRRSKPSGYRFLGEHNYGKPTKKQIQQKLDGKRDDIYFESRLERSDRKPYSKRGERFETGGKVKKDYVGKSGKQYGFTLKGYEKHYKKQGLFVSPKDYWKKVNGTKYKDFMGRPSTITKRDKDRIMHSYAYKIMIGLDLGSKLIPNSAKKYAESIYTTDEFVNVGKYEKGGEFSDNDYYNVVNHFVYFTQNYPNNFLDAFGEKDNSIRKHIEQKFDYAYKKHGSWGAMVYFWTELDGKNKEKLANWIKENYKGKPLNYEGDTTGIIDHFVYFTQNYPNNFMDAFDSEGKNIKEHIQSKFDSYYEKYGSYAVMIKFWIELDYENQKLFADWIKENYTGTTLRYSKGGSITTSKLNEFISTINEEGGGEFTLGGAYGFQELWAWNYKTKGNDRIEVGSKKDIYNALIKYRYAERYNPKYSDGKYTSDKMESGGELSDVMSLVEIESKLGRPLHWWNDDVVYFDDVRYKKVFMRPEYKKID